MNEFLGFEVTRSGEMYDDDFSVNLIELRKRAVKLKSNFNQSFGYSMVN